MGTPVSLDLLPATAPGAGSSQPPARGKPPACAFRTVVVEGCAHTCARCGARLRTPSGRSAVQAAYIVPFSACRSNDPRNGLALCPLHHWAFDQGMLTVTASYAVKVHAYALELPADEPFCALQGRTLRRPSDERMLPAPAALAWHQKKVFGMAG